MVKVLYRCTGTDDVYLAFDYGTSVYWQAAGGVLNIRGSDHAQLTLEKCISHPLTITHYTSDYCQTTWRRSATQIRKESFPCFDVRFIERGMRYVSTSSGDQHIEADTLCISLGNVPYHSTSLPDSQGRHEAYQVYVPEHLVAHRLGRGSFNRTYSTREGQGAICKELMRLIYNHGASATAEQIDGLGHAFITALANCVQADHEAYGKKRLSREAGAGSWRVQEILRCLERNAAHPDLDVATVARECGISRRYMSALLGKYGSTFGDLLKRQRVELAKRMLREIVGSHVIGEIATLSGFKSLPHFSRVFKQMTGFSPRDFRTQMAIESVGVGGWCESSANTQVQA